jgi:DNA-binding phage protein
MMGAQLDKPLDGRAILDAAAIMSQAGVDNDVIERALGQVRSHLIRAEPVVALTRRKSPAVGASRRLPPQAPPPIGIGLQMVDAGLPYAFVLAATQLGLKSKPVEALAPRAIKLTDLDAISENVQAFKDRLRLVVESKGGITKLSEMTKIPQPSLSRFFNSGAMPRRTTLLKIQQALGLDQIDLDARWIV